MCLLGRNLGVKWTHQPVERCVIDQIIHDVVQGFFHFAQLDFAVGQHAVWQVSQHFSLAEVVVDQCCRAANGEHLLLDVVGETLQAGNEDQAGGLELLSEGTCQSQGARLNGLDRGKEQILKVLVCLHLHSQMYLSHCIFDVSSSSSLPLPRGCFPGLDHWTSTPPKNSACHLPSG